MFSLFSSFDYFWLLFPIRLEFASFLIMLTLFYNLSLFGAVLRNLYSFILSFFSTLTSSFNFGSMPLFFILIFFFSCSNFFSVFPYNFAHTSQLSIVFFTGLSVWLSFNLFGTFQNLQGYLSHLIPEGGPLALSPVLFIIEGVSNIIRPLTLSVRLVANILAGHLLLILLSNVVMASPYTFILYLGLNSVEIFVALIQSYIFVTMVSLYYCDVS